MAITLRSVTGSALSYEQLDTNFSSMFYSASLSGSNIWFHTTGSTGITGVPEPTSMSISITATSNWTNLGTGAISRNSNVEITGSLAQGVLITSTGDYSHAEGSGSQSSGAASHAEGFYTLASGNYSHAEGSYTTAAGTGSHAEGVTTLASGQYSHAEGDSTTASGISSHAEGSSTVATGSYSHAEGLGTTDRKSTRLNSSHLDVHLLSRMPSSA
jgi:hypothetical protein